MPIPKIWARRFGEIQILIDQLGRFPYDSEIESPRLRIWLRQQRHRWAKLNRTQQLKLTARSGFEISLREAHWNETFRSYINWMDTHHHKPRARSTDPIERRLADWMYQQNKQQRAGTESFYRAQRLKQVRPPKPRASETITTDYLLDDDRLGIVRRAGNIWSLYYTSPYDKRVPLNCGRIFTNGPEPTGPATLLLFDMYRIATAPKRKTYASFDEAVDQAFDWLLVTSSSVSGLKRHIYLAQLAGTPPGDEFRYDQTIEQWYP